MRKLASLLAIAATVLGVSLGTSGCGAGVTPQPVASTSAALAPKAPAPQPAGVDAPTATFPATQCSPHPSATVTLTVVKPRTDGIFVGRNDNGDIGIRFLPDGTLLYAVYTPGTPVSWFQRKLTLQNVTNTHGDWQHVTMDSVGDFTITIFGGSDYYTVFSYTSRGFTLYNQNNFNCASPAQVHTRTILMRFYS